MQLRPAFVFGCLLLLAARTASAAQYEIFIEIETEEELYDLLFTEQISQSSFDALLLLHQTRVDLNRAARPELYLLPNLDYGHVDRVLAFRETVAGIRHLDDLIEAGVLEPELARSIRAFVTVRDPGRTRSETKGLLRIQSRWTGRYDRPPPASGLQLRIQSLSSLDVGMAGALTRNSLRRVRWDPTRNALSAAPEGVRFEVPKLYVEWDDEKWEVVVGTYRIGFGQRLTFDVTNQITPNGSFGDYELRRDNELRLRCRRGAGELPQSPCPIGVEARVTPDYTWTNRLAGVAIGLKELRLGEGWLQGYVWGSYQVHRALQSELVNAAACDDPSRDADSACRAPSVYVRESDSGAPSSIARFASLPAAYAEGLAGANMSYFWNERAHLGLTGYASVPRWLIRGPHLDFQESARKPFGGAFGALGADAAFGFGPQDFFAEITRSFDAAPGQAGYAAVIRSVTTLSKAEVETSLRYYGSHFSNPYARPISAPDELDGLRARDEAGLRCRVTARPKPKVTLRSTVDGWRQLSSAALNALLFVRSDWRISSSWTWAHWVEYRSGAGQRFVVATRLGYEPLRSVGLSAQLRYRWGGRLGATRLQQDLAAILSITSRPVDRLRVRARLRYDLNDVWNNHRLPQAIWSYLDAALKLRDRDTLRLRYDVRVFLDQRESTPGRVPNPEHWLWVEYVWRF